MWHANSMNYPPTKRLRGLNHDVRTAAAFDDPFGDDQDFTQDDLDEIDILASQAGTSIDVGTRMGFKPGPKAVEPTAGPTRPSSAGQNKPPSTTTVQRSENAFGLSSSNIGNAGASSREPLGYREDSYSVLEAQHAELKRKLGEVEEEIVLKSGEIRVLRDSLKAAQQEKEAQRQNQILLDTQKQKEHSDKEKELNKKVQSLQTELQFKEAEINEMKTKLHSSDRNKLGSPPPNKSPKVISLLVPRPPGSSSSSPVGNGFITKEMFGAQVSSRTTPVKTKRDAERGTSSSRFGDKQEASRPDPFQSVRPAHRQHRGGVLLGLLLQQPLSPSSLGLSHLLSMSLTDIHQTSSQLSAGFLVQFDAAVGVGGAAPASLSPVQSLAVTGLNMLSQNQQTASWSNKNNRSCSGAVLLLPLLDLHLSRLCQALDSLHSSSAPSAGSSPSTSSSVTANRAAPGSAGPGRLGEAGSSGLTVEDTGLAALRLLHLLLAYSDEVVEAVLLNETPGGTKTQNALLPSLLRLCKIRLEGSGSQTEEIPLNAMKTLCVLSDRTQHTHTDRLQCVLQAVCSCVSADSRVQMVSECVSVLTSMSDHQALATHLCSQHDPCVFLKLLQFIRTRPDSREVQAHWIQLDLQVVRLLSRLMTQRAETWTADPQNSCQCNTELVQTVVIVFHRQWLDLRAIEAPTDTSALPLGDCPTSPLPWWSVPAASLLRESLLLLHWLLLHHAGFSESCRPLLHMYDQVIPAVRDTLRKIPGLSESEELALEEICRSEGDDTDDMDTDGS